MINRGSLETLLSVNHPLCTFVRLSASEPMRTGSMKNKSTYQYLVPGTVGPWRRQHVVTEV
jgi:hypothetical protein